MSPALTFTWIACLGMLVQSFVGFAGSLIAVPLFAILLTPQEAIPAYSMVMVFINLSLVLDGRRHVRWGTVGKFLIGGLVGVPIGVYGLKHMPIHVIGLVISAVTFAFALLFLFKVRVNIPDRLDTQAGIGLTSGLLGGMISESGPPVVIYGLSRGWAKDEFRTTLLTYFSCLSILQVISCWCLDLYSPETLRWSAFALVPTLAVAFVGTFLKDRANEAVFRYVVLGVVILVSVLGALKHLVFT